MSLPGLDLPTLSFAVPLDGETHADTLTVDLDHLITSRLLIQGSSGAGKGWAIRTLLEQTHGRVQQIVLDKEGEFSTLREQFDYILAGAEGDVPATPHAARLLCRQLMDLGASAVLDLYDLSLPDRQKFVRLFLEELMSLPKELWRPLLVVIDEAHFFVPEGGSTEASSAVKSLCAEGRKRGYAAVIATQRLSKLSKDVAAELRNKMIGLTSLDVDVRRAADDLGFSREQAARLKELSPGEFFCVGPAIAKKVVLAKTGEVKTTHPRAGQIAAYTPPPPAEAVQALLQQLKGLAEEAEAEVRAEQEKADRTAALERQVESLQKQLMEAPGLTEVKERVVEKIVEVERLVEVPALEPGQVEQLRDIADTLLAGGKDMVGMAQEILARVSAVQKPPTPNLGEEQADESRNGLKTSEISVKEAVSAPPDGPKSAKLPTPNNEATVNPNHGGTPGSGQTVPRPQQAILDALADFASLGVLQPRREHVAISIKVSPTSSGYRNNLSALRTLGLIEYPQNGLVSLTTTGRTAGHTSGLPPTVTTLRQAWYRWLPGPQAQIMKVLVGLGHQVISRGDLAVRVGASPDSSGYRNNLSALRSLGLLDYPASGRVMATDLLFPVGLLE